MAGVKTEAALERLGTALKRLEATLTVERQMSREVSWLAGDRAHLEHDRDRLAHELDAAEERAERLAKANDEVARRLIAIMEEVRRLPGSRPNGAARGTP